jgi:hypothetical protein
MTCELSLYFQLSLSQNTVKKGGPETLSAARMEQRGAVRLYFGFNCN